MGPVGGAWPDDVRAPLCPGMNSPGASCSHPFTLSLIASITPAGEGRAPSVLRASGPQEGTSAGFLWLIPGAPAVTPCLGPCSKPFLWLRETFDFFLESFGPHPRASLSFLPLECLSLLSFLKACPQCCLLHEAFSDFPSGGVVFPFPMLNDTLLGITDDHIFFFPKSLQTT